MKHILLKPDLAPLSLSRARERGLEWDTYSHSDDGHQLRQAKAAEQQNFCGYCECHLTDDEGVLSRGVSHIDHFFPRHKGTARRPDLIFDWSNMVLSCMCRKTCGFYKDRQKTPASDIIDPHNEDPRTFFTFVMEDNRYLSALPITTLDSQGFKKAENTIEALQLNVQRLRLARHTALHVHKQEIDLLITEFQRSASDEFAILQQLAQELIDLLELKPFSSALVAYATAELKDFIEVK